MNNARYAIFAALLAAASGASAQTDSQLATSAAAMLAAQSACGQPGAFSGPRERLLLKAAQGVPALRSYVYITRGIYQYDLYEVATWIDGWRADQARCDSLTLATSAQK